jgi:hypothetical protein
MRLIKVRPLRPAPPKMIHPQFTHYRTLATHPSHGRCVTPIQGALIPHLAHTTERLELCRLQPRASRHDSVGSL